MGPKPTPLLRVLPLDLFLMRLPSSSSLLLATLAISSSSSSSLSALAAPTGDHCPEDSSSSAPVPHGSDDTMAQPNSTRPSCTITFLPDTATDHLQSRSLVTPLTSDLGNLISDLLNGITKPLTARGGPVDTLTHLIPVNPRAERSDASGPGAAPGDSPTQPAPAAPAPPPAAAPPLPANPLPIPPPPLAGLPLGSLPVRRDSGSGPELLDVLSPVLPEIPPNTPVPSQSPAPSQ